MSADAAETRRPLDRRADERRTEDLLASVLADPATRVLDLALDRLPAVAGPGPGRTQRLAWRPANALDARSPGPYAFLGRDEAGTAYAAAMHPAAPPDADWAGLREIGAWLDERDQEAAMTAVGLARWHARNGHCPGCGTATGLTAAGWARRCPAEGTEHFPRTDPAVIVAVVDPADRLLLARGPTFTQGWASVLAGFVEPGETLEGTVVREMAEEVGLTVTEVTYVGSQPWPFPASIMLGFTARATSAALNLDPDEIAEARWYHRAELAADLAAGRLGIPGRLSIARRLIEGWYGGPLRQRREVGTIRTDAG